MAQTLTLSANLSVNKNGGGAVTATVNLNLTPASTGYIDEPQTVNTGSWQAIAPLATLASTPGNVLFKNTDTTGTVTIALDNAGANVLAILLPGGVALIQPSTHTLFAEATTNACVLQVTGSNL